MGWAYRPQIQEGKKFVPAVCFSLASCKLKLVQVQWKKRENEETKRKKKGIVGGVILLLNSFIIRLKWQK